MIVHFTTSEAVSADFYETVLLGAVVAFIMAMTALLCSREKRPILSVRTISVVGLVGFGCVVSVAYFSTYDRFIRAQVDNTGIKLVYSGPFGKEVTIPRNSIENVLFGLPGKTNRQCYIRVLQHTGESYRSATVVKQSEACKSLRADISAKLEL